MLTLEMQVMNRDRQARLLDDAAAERFRRSSRARARSGSALSWSRRVSVRQRHSWLGLVRRAKPSNA